MLYYIVGIFILVVLFAVFLLLKYSKKTGLSKEKKSFFKKNLTRIKVNKSAKERIIEYDKNYHKILQSLGYEGTFGEILKKKPKEIRDLNRIWELHKLRNKLVHDFDLLSDGVLRKKSSEFEQEINALLR